MKLIQKCTTNPVLSTTQAFKETLRQTGYDAIDRSITRFRHSIQCGTIKVNYFQFGSPQTGKKTYLEWTTLLTRNTGLPSTRYYRVGWIGLQTKNDENG